MSGVSACVIHDGRVVWSGSQGLANREAGILADGGSLYMLASTSKTVTGLALLQLWERGAFELDDNVNRYLPFEIIHPRFPSDSITFRRLLTHTASIGDNIFVMQSTYVLGDTPIPLAQYVHDYFVPGGCYYDSVFNFVDRVPGTAYRYSNHGIVLAGYLVEAISGVPFARYCVDSIFRPLGMDETSWFLADLDTGRVAIPYSCVTGEFVPFGLYGYADYPAGTLRTSVNQLGTFLLALSQHGSLGGVRIVDSTTVDSIFSYQCPELSAVQGLVWYRADVAGYVVWSHTGRDGGVSTSMGYCPEHDLGVVVLANGDRHNVIYNIYYHLFNWAAGDADSDGLANMDDLCPWSDYYEWDDLDGDGVGDDCDNCAGVPNRWQDDADDDGIGDACDVCCIGRVGDANGVGGDEPTIGDVSLMIDALFITASETVLLTPPACMAEADVNLSSLNSPAHWPPVYDDITIGDISILIDYLFITGSSLGLPSCY